jgi:hypothetical protein
VILGIIDQNAPILVFRTFISMGGILVRLFFLAIRFILPCFRNDGSYLYWCFEWRWGLLLRSMKFLGGEINGKIYGQ